MSHDLSRVLFEMLAAVRRVGYLTSQRAEAALASMIAADDRFADFHALPLAQVVIQVRTTRKVLDLDEPSFHHLTVPAD